MSTTKQKAFEIHRIDHDGTIESCRMRWPEAAVRERLKVTVPDDSEPEWIAVQLCRLADQIETRSVDKLSK